MFYVQKPEMVNKTFRLPENLVSRLSAVAQQQGVSMNNLVAQCCSYALDHLANPDAKEDTKTN
jgi:predicted HicB family RNase H-like nuclease